MTDSDRVVDLRRWRSNGEVADEGSRDDDDIADCAELRRQIAELQASDAVALAVATGYYDPDLDTEVVTALRFQACTAADGDGISEPFAAAADYLVAHPEVSVVATNWRTTPCDTGAEHLILEVTVRVNPGEDRME